MLREAGAGFGQVRRTNGVGRAKRLLAAQERLSRILEFMKRINSLATFKKRLREALISKQSKLNKLGPFRNDPFKLGSGKALATAIYATFGVELANATVQRWINGEGFPSEDNWPLLTALVEKSRDWLTGALEANGNSVAGFEATEPVRPYGNALTKERALELLREAARIIEEEL